MATLVTGSSGHLGEGLMIALRERREPAIGLDLKASSCTDVVGSITDRDMVRRALEGVSTVFHTATLHKPHVATHPHDAFVQTNIAGTLALLEKSVAAGVRRFIYTSTTSAFGSALTPPPGEPAAWVTEDVVPVPKNIYGVTKTAAENLCELFARRRSLPVIVLRTSRFFHQPDDDAALREAYDPDNLQANELLYRRVDLADVVDAHFAAATRAADIGFGRYIISASTPFAPSDLPQLRADLPAVVRRYFPAYEALYREAGWRMLPSIDRVYVNQRAVRELGWAPRYDFKRALEALASGAPIRSPLADVIGAKGYHDQAFEGAPYPVE